MGNTHFKDGDYDKAIRCYSYALKHDKSNYYLLSNRCFAYIKQEQFGFAYNDAIMILKINPSHAKAYYRLAQIYQALDLPVDANIALQKALSLEPESQEVKTLLLVI